MKNKLIIMLLLVVLIGGCKNKEEGKIMVDEKMPVKVVYQRMWEYGLQSESDDEELIKTLLKQLNEIKLGNKTDMCVDDYTDILTFEYPDGSKSQYVFEADIYVKSEDDRYEVTDGLKDLRNILDSMVEGK